MKAFRCGHLIRGGESCARPEGHHHAHATAEAYARELEKARLRQREYRPVVDSTVILEQRRRGHAKLKTAAFARYGSKCACCGSTENLQIDHVNGDGYEQRLVIGNGRRTNGSSRTFYQWLRVNHYPAGFQALCRSCNHSKGSGMRCRIHGYDFSPVRTEIPGQLALF